MAINFYSIKKAILMMVILVFIYNCQTTDIHTGLESKLDDVRFSSEELRLRINNFTLKFSGRVESAADQIIANSDDKLIKQNALIWKLNSIPTVNEAVFIAEPFAAAIDTWAFSLQMLNFFDSGNGKNLFGTHQSVAINTSKIIESQIKQLVYEGLLDTELDFAAKYVYPWVKDNPIKDISFTRESTIDITAKLISDRKRNLASSVGEIETTVNDLSMKLNIYYDQLPKLASWRLELLANTFMHNDKIDSLHNYISSITDSFERISAMIGDSENLLDTSIMETFDRVEKLRLNVKRDLQYEREILLSAISDERSIILKDINKQRLETIKDFKILSEELIGKVSVTANDSIDHFFIRLFQLVVIIFLIGAIFIFIFNKYFQKQTAEG